MYQPEWHAIDQCICLAQGEERRERRKVRQLHLVQPTTPLTTALSMLLEAGVSVLPIVDAVSCTATVTKMVLWLEHSCVLRQQPEDIDETIRTCGYLMCALTGAERGAHRPVCKSRHHAAGKGQCLQSPAVGGNDCGSGACPGPDWQPPLACLAARDASAGEQLSC